MTIAIIIAASIVAVLLALLALAYIHKSAWESGFEAGWDNHADIAAVESEWREMLKEEAEEISRN